MAAPVLLSKAVPRTGRKPGVRNRYRNGAVAFKRSCPRKGSIALDIRQRLPADNEKPAAHKKHRKIKRMIEVEISSISIDLRCLAVLPPVRGFDAPVTVECWK